MVALSSKVALHKLDLSQALGSVDKPRSVFKAQNVEMPNTDPNRLSSKLRAVARKISTVENIKQSKKEQWENLQDEMTPLLKDIQLKRKVNNLINDENYEDPNPDFLESLLVKANYHKSNRNMQRFLAYYIVKSSKLIDVLHLYKASNLNPDFVAALKDDNFIPRAKLVNQFHESLHKNISDAYSVFNSILINNLIEILYDKKEDSIHFLKSFLKELFIKKSKTRQNTYDNIPSYVATLAKDDKDSPPQSSDLQVQGLVRYLLRELYEEHPNHFDLDDYLFAEQYYNPFELSKVHKILTSASEPNSKAVQYHLSLINKTLIKILASEKPIKKKVEALQEMFIDFRGEDEFKEIIRDNLNSIKHPSLLAKALLICEDEDLALEYITKAAEKGNFRPAASIAVAANKEEFFAGVLKKFYLSQTNLQDTLNKLVTQELPECLWEDESTIYSNMKYDHNIKNASYNDLLKPVLNQLNLEGNDSNAATILEAINQYQVVKELYQTNSEFIEKVKSANTTLAA